MAKETIYLTSAVRLAGDDQDTPAGTEVSVEAADAAGGLRVLQSVARIDLLVTDVGLPGMNGRQLADQARESRPHLKVLFITGYAENAMFGNGHLDPGMQMITKPFPVETLAARIREMIES